MRTRLLKFRSVREVLLEPLVGKADVARLETLGLDRTADTARVERQDASLLEQVAALGERAEHGYAAAIAGVEAEQPAVARVSGR